MLGQILIQESFLLNGCQEYCDVFMELADKSTNSNLKLYGYLLKAKILQNLGDFKMTDQYFMKAK